MLFATFSQIFFLSFSVLLPVLLQLLLIELLESPRPLVLLRLRYLICQRLITESCTLVFFTNLDILRYEKLFCLIHSFRSGERLWINLKHNSSSNFTINAAIPQNFVPILFFIHKLKSTKLTFNVLNLWVCVSFPHAENWNNNVELQWP